MSRPKLGHTERVEVRVSPALLDLATRAAASEAVPLTEWFRRAALTRLAAVASLRCVHGVLGVCVECDEEHE